MYSSNLLPVTAFEDSINPPCCLVAVVIVVGLFWVEINFPVDFSFSHKYDCVIALDALCSLSITVPNLCK